MKKKWIWITVICVLLLIIGALLFYIMNNKKPTYDLAGKTFYNTVDEFDNNEHANVWFGKDGTFVLRDNFHDGYYEASGTWSVKEDVCTLDVKEVGVGNYKTIVFEIEDEDTLILKTTLAGSKLNDKFTTTKPTSTNKPNTNTKVTSELFTSSCTPNNKSSVELRSDGSFTFLDRNAFGITEVNGTYIDRGDYLELSNIENNPFGGSITSISLKKYNANTYILQTDLPISMHGDVFTKDGNCPAELVKTPIENNYHNTSWIHEKTDMVANDEFLPSVQFMNIQGKGYSFAFTENCYSAMVQITGSYTADERYIICTVEDGSQLKGFAGEGIQYIEFEVINEKTLKLLSDINMSKAGDLFTRQ